MGKQRFCPCGNQASGSRGVPACSDCRKKRLREAQRRYYSKKNGSYQFGTDSSRCCWCEADMEVRPFQVLRPKRFCSSRCRAKYGNEKKSKYARESRKCVYCGGAPANRTGSAVCASCREANRGRLKRHAVLRVYGLSVDDYELMLSAQGGRCAICRAKEPGGGRDVFFVDHDHGTGEVRELLCANCNTALGLLKDDPAVIERARKYVLRHRQAQLFGPAGEVKGTA